MRGLCGTFDWNRENDFMSTSGMEDRMVSSFAEGYRTYQDDCDEVKYKAETHCSKNMAMEAAAKQVRDFSHPAELCDVVKYFDRFK